MYSNNPKTMQIISRKGSDNSAHIGWYLSGFCDGEGSFNVSLRVRTDHKLRWQVVLTFNVAQRDVTNLLLLQKHLQCGRLQKRSDGVHYFVVTDYVELLNKVIPFFEQFPLQSKSKKKNFEIFKHITKIMNTGEHLKPEGFMSIVDLRERLNEGKGRKRKYEKGDVMKDYLRILRDYTPNSALLIEKNEMI
jgi:hypothetical protein